MGPYGKGEVAGGRGSEIASFSPCVQQRNASTQAGNEVQHWDPNRVERNCLNLLARGQVFQSYFLSEAKFPSSLLFDAKSSKRACQGGQSPNAQRTCQRPSVAHPLELLIAHVHVSANQISECAAKLKWIFTSHHTALHTSSCTACNRSLHCLVSRLARTPPI